MNEADSTTSNNRVFVACVWGDGPHELEARTNDALRLIQEEGGIVAEILYAATTTAIDEGEGLVDRISVLIVYRAERELWP